MPNGFNTRKGEFIAVTASGTDGPAAAPIPSLADLTVALVTSAPGANAVKLPEGSVGDVVEVISVDFGGDGGQVQVFHPDGGTYLGTVNGTITYRRLPDSGGSISWMIVARQ